MVLSKLARRLLPARCSGRLVVRTQGSSPTPTLAYSSALTAPTILWFARWCYAIWRGLLDQQLADDYVRSVTLRYAGTMIACILGVALVAIGPWKIGMTIIAIATFPRSV